METLLARSP